jgi:hypothetical protein
LPKAIDSRIFDVDLDLPGRVSGTRRRKNHGMRKKAPLWVDDAAPIKLQIAILSFAVVRRSPGVNIIFINNFRLMNRVFSTRARPDRRA